MKAVLEKYVQYVDNQDPSIMEGYFSDRLEGADPYGSHAGLATEVLARLANVPFHTKKAEQTGPVRTTIWNKAAVPFKLYADVDGHAMTIDIIDIMAFDQDGKICKIEAFWGKENVTLIN